MEKCHHLCLQLRQNSQNKLLLQYRIREKNRHLQYNHAIMQYVRKDMAIPMRLTFAAGICVLLITSCIPAPTINRALQSPAITATPPLITAPPVWKTTSASPTSSKTITAQPTKTKTITPLPSPSPSLPPQVRIPLKGKNQTLPLSCEARSAVDWAAYFGVKIEELAFQQKLPLSDNPEEGFVGDVNGVWGLLPPRSYGVHAPPVAALLREYGLTAQARRQMTLEELKREIAAGRPVIVWVTGHVQAGTPSTYTTRTGRKVRVAVREHTVIVVGYTPETIIVLDGALTYGRATQNFLESWNVLDNMAVVMAE